MSPVRTYTVEVAPPVLGHFGRVHARATVPLRLEYGAPLSRVGHGGTRAEAIDRAVRSVVAALVLKLEADISYGDQTVDGLVVRFVVRERDA